MSEISLVDLRPGLTQAMDRVASGESITITRYGKPIGVIVPVPLLEALRAKVGELSCPPPMRSGPAMG